MLFTKSLGRLPVTCLTCQLLTDLRVPWPKNGALKMGNLKSSSEKPHNGYDTKCRKTFSHGPCMTESTSIAIFLTEHFPIYCSNTHEYNKL